MKNMFGEKTRAILLHVLSWLALWFIMSFWASKGGRLDEYLIKNISILIPMVGIVYINWFWLFPRFFAKRKYWQFALLVLLAIYVVFYIGEITIVEWMELTFPNRQKNILDFDPYAPPKSFWRIMNGSAPYTLGILSSTIFLAIRQKRQDEKENSALRLENAQTKIKYLQSQISPHFLFNSLNNVHSLILQDKQQASEYIIKLSDLLRFMIYETDKDFITLGDEINLLKKYVALVDFRIGTSDVSKNLKISIENNELGIPPLLVFGILENGVKHSGMTMENNFLFNMTIEESQGQLTVKMNNSISNQKFDKKKKGFGIESLKKRLSMYYPNSYTFDFQKLGEKAKTVLTINLIKSD